MSREDDQILLERLKAELEFIEHGGYRERDRASWRPSSIFLDSPACFHMSAPQERHSCEECPLMQFVPEEHRKKKVPCHYIPLNEAGDTIKSAEAWADQDEIEDLVKTWLRGTMVQLEQNLANSRAKTPPVQNH